MNSPNSANVFVDWASKPERGGRNGQERWREIRKARFNGIRFGRVRRRPRRLHRYPWVKRLLIANAVVFLVSVGVGFEVVADLFAFSPSRLATRPWGMLTYMFVHQGLWHLLINLLFIFFFGPPLEARWGSDLFIKFYLVCGLGGVLLSFMFSGASIVGASAACYGIMLSFAMIWPNTPVYIWGLVPVRVKWLVVFLVLLSFASAIGPARDGVAHLAHLGGAVAGFLLVQSGWLPGSGRSRSDAGRPGSGAAGRRRRRTPWRSTLGRRGRSGRGPKAYTSGFGRRGRKGRRDAPAAAGEPSATRVIEAFEGRRAAKRAARERAELDRVDAVLDKISAQGINSLTAEERDLLDKVSRQTRAN